jgi:hypothetical protein
MHDTAMDDNEWWATSGPLLARVLDETAYPIAARVGSAAGAAYGGAHSPGHAYTFGLERVLAGLSQLIGWHSGEGLVQQSPDYGPPALRPGSPAIPSVSGRKRK